LARFKANAFLLPMNFDFLMHDSVAANLENMTDFQFQTSWFFGVGPLAPRAQAVVMPAKSPVPCTITFTVNYACGNPTGRQHGLSPERAISSSAARRRGHPSPHAAMVPAPPAAHLQADSPACC